MLTTRGVIARTDCNDLFELVISTHSLYSQTQLLVGPLRTGVS